MYLEVIAVLHYNNHDGVIHVCALKACVSSEYSKCITAIKRMLPPLYYRHVYILVFFHVQYLCISCYCETCLKSSALRVGVKTLYNTILIIECMLLFVFLLIVIR